MVVSNKNLQMDNTTLKLTFLLSIPVPRPPLDVEILNSRTTQTSLTAAWEHPMRPSDDSPIPVVDQYVMEVTRGGNPAGSQTVDGEDNTATVDGLEVSTEYDVHVTSLAGVGVDNVRSDTVTVTASTGKHINPFMFFVTNCCSYIILQIGNKNILHCCNKMQCL